jgi:hypothetical protein
VRSGRAALLLGALAAGGTSLVVLAADRATDAASSPIRPDGAWRATLLAAAVLAFAAYVGGVLVLRRSGASLPAVCALAVAVQLVPLAGPTLLSTDVWTYWMYGRIDAVHGGNPYRDAPSRYADDIAYGEMGSSWHDTTSLYGPLFTLASVGHAKVAGDDPGRAAWLYRAGAAAAMLGVVVAATALARQKAFAAAFVGWNPVLALHFAGGGHNDAAMMALVLLALLLGARGRPNLAGVAWAAAIAIKWVPVAFLALWLVHRRRAGRPLGLAGLAAGAAAIAVVSTAAFGLGWLHASGGLSSQARRTGSFGLARWLGDAGLSHRPQLAVIGLFLLCAFAFLVREAWRGRLRLGLSGSALAFGQGWLNPWYASWGVSLSAPEEDGAAHLASLALCALVLRDALPI